MTYSAKTVLVELRREMRMRERNYPRWVNEGKMKQTEANHQIEVLKHVIGIFQAEALKDEPELKI